MNFVVWYHNSHYFSSFWPSFSFSWILGEVPEEGDPEDLWSKPDPKGLRLPPLRSLLDNELLMLLRVLVIPLVWRRDSTGLSSLSSKIGMLSRAWTSHEAQSGIFCSCAYLSLVTDRSARTSRAPNIAPAERKFNCHCRGSIFQSHTSSPCPVLQRPDCWSRGTNTLGTRVLNFTSWPLLFKGWIVLSTG